MSRRAWTVGLLTGALVLAGVGAVAVTRWLPRCGDHVVELSPDRSSSPFLDAGERAEQPDHDRDTLVEALAAAPAPFGEVVGAVGYHYEQWAQVDSFAQGVGVRTRDNPDFTMLDDQTLEPRWSVEVQTRRSTYDASDRRYLVGTLPGDADAEVVALDAEDGQRVWCTTLEGQRVEEGQSFLTQLLDDEDVVVLTGGPDRDERLVRLSGEDGSQVWEERHPADEGDHLGSLGEDVLVAGGSPQALLVDPVLLSRRTEGQALVAFSAEDGTRRWSRRTAAGTGLHVVGTDAGAGVVVIAEWSGPRPTGRLRALDRDGRELWSVRPAGPGPFDATVRAGRVLVRSDTRWAAYDVAGGDPLWQRVVPARPQFLPYGFELDSLPLLDGDHALVGGTTALHTLDLRTGAMTAARLPTDGINTTHWPYQLAVTERLIAVATNTGAVVVRRD
jgi:hypothetical protein